MIAAVVRALRCPDTPEWRSAIEAMARRIRAAREREDASPKRTAARKELAEVERIAKRLATLLRDPTVQEALTAAPAARDAVTDDAAGLAFLATMERKAKRAATSIRPGAGEDGLRRSLGEADARLLCAACVAQAMMKLNDAEPGEKNPAALAACDALWRTSGGEDGRGDRGEGETWRRHLRRARGKEPLPGGEVAEGRALGAVLSGRMEAKRCLGALHPDLQKSDPHPT